MQKRDGSKIIFIIGLIIMIFLLSKGFYSGKATRSEITIANEDVISIGGNSQNVIVPGGPADVQIAPEPSFCQSPIAPGGIIITTPGYYKLCGGTINLPSPIRILADDVILDCAGTTLVGTPNYAFNGIEVLGDRVTIKDCKLKKFKDAISIDRKDNTKLLNHELYENINGIHVSGADSGNLYSKSWRGKNYEFLNNNIHNNQKDGVLVERTPSYWISGATARISNNNINNNENGIHFVYSEEYTIIENNGISSNSKNGIYLDEQSSYPGQPGYGSRGAHIRFNNILSNGENGLKLQRSYTWVVYKNLFQNNAQNNIYIWPAGGSSIISNNILNSINGVYADIPDMVYPGSPGYQNDAYVFIQCNNIKVHSNAGVNFVHLSQAAWSNGYMSYNRVENNNYGLYIDYSAGPNYVSDWATMNEFKNNQNGIYAISGGNKIFYHNNFIANAIMHAYDATTFAPDEWDYTYSWAPETHGNYWDDYSGTPDPSNPDHYYGPRIIPPSGNQDDAPEINPLGIPPDPTVICSDYGSPVICGDGVINQWWEKCDPPDMGMCAPGTCIPPNQPGECTCPLNNTVQFPENPPK
ncbi:MAG: right-handed parallel beta-helix repeat-containing protein [Nanoarchaeota archaeon]|mgnify:CR=1 FL=1